MNERFQWLWVLFSKICFNIECTVDFATHLNVAEALNVHSETTHVQAISHFFGRRCGLIDEEESETLCYCNERGSLPLRMRGTADDTGKRDPLTARLTDHRVRH